MIRHFAEVNGKRVAYWVRNPEAAATLVMVHGFRGNHKGLDYVARELKGLRLVMPDLPGYGESEPLDVPHTIEHYGQWLDDFAAELGLKRWVSWSHSGSGPIALVQAARGKCPPQAMVAVSLALPIPGASTIGITAYYRLGQLMPPRLRHAWLTNRLIDHAMGRWLFMTLSSKKRREIQRRAERDLPKLNAQVITEQYFSSLSTQSDEYAKILKMPVLVIAGARDMIVPLDRLKRLVALIPDATLEVLVDQGHLSPMEKPAEVAGLTERFVDAVLSKSSA